MTGAERHFRAVEHLYALAPKRIEAVGVEIGRGTGAFMRPRIALSGLPGYAPGGNR